MPGNIRLTRDEMNNLLNNMANPLQSTIDARRLLFEEIASLEINQRSEGVMVNAPFIDYQGLKETLSQQKQYTNAIKIEIGEIKNSDIGISVLNAFLTRKSGDTNPTKIIDGKPVQGKQPFSIESSASLAA